jgi:hypothetical protein
MMLRLVDLVVRRVDRVINRLDYIATDWLLRRTDLPKPLVMPLLEQLAARVGAKLEITDLPS